MSQPVERSRTEADVLALLGIPDTPENRAPEASAETAEQDGSVGRRIAEARRRVHLTGAELGARVDLGRDQISKIETGKRRLGAREAPEIARALGVSVEWLLGQDESPRMALAHRLALGVAGDEVPREDLPATQRRALEILEIDRVLSSVVDVPRARLSAMGAQVLRSCRTDPGGRPRNKLEAQRQGRRLAEKVREELDLGSAEIRDLTALIESHFGVDVVLSRLGRTADGLCAHTTEQALIVASTDFPDGHVRFTLAHELGHHLVSDPREVITEGGEQMFSDDIAERRVNAFAAHLLLPEAGVRAALSGLGAPAGELADGSVGAQRVLGNLMVRFGVSLQALLFQLADLHVLTFDEAVALKKSLRVRQITARHSTGTGMPLLGAPLADSVCEVVRPPQRLLEAALTAARSGRIGTRLIAALLERDDDEALFDEVMGAVEEEAEALSGVADGP
ncbi:XRE family transcriptional regulator [Kineosporia mesophila]|uniref:XRE family transcriptional regulator n=1 Tax=Kineosporia mesophila TaxID=566012 RepID=A0ABP7A2J1_9ACTN|nr:XRE family transcriptional regulator [Kineosporia mesophila]MCD5348999.1 XRE family transcriptional regulator [Kineosporia mesophila]